MPKIYEILSEKYQLRPKRRKNRAPGAVPQASAPRQLVQIDTVDFGQLFAFTAVDIWSREVDVLLRPSLNSHDGVLFLRFCMGRRFGHVGLLQCDGGSEWKGEFPLRARLFCDRLRIARPYKKNKQAFIESFNRTLRKECLGWNAVSPSNFPFSQPVSKPSWSATTTTGLTWRSTP